MFFFFLPTASRRPKGPLAAFLLVHGPQPPGITTRRLLTARKAGQTRPVRASVPTRLFRGPFRSWPLVASTLLRSMHCRWVVAESKSLPTLFIRGTRAARGMVEFPASARIPESVFSFQSAVPDRGVWNQYTCRPARSQPETTLEGVQHQQRSTCSAALIDRVWPPAVVICTSPSGVYGL